MNKRPFDFEGFRVVVTGGGSGIGASLVRELSGLGADIVVLDVEGCADGAGAIACDVANAESVAHAFELIGERFESIHGLVQCAGINRDAVFWKIESDDWDAVLDVNLKGAFHVMKAAVPAMRRGGGGSIVNVGSINGLRGKFGQANYAASKAGLVGLTKTAAKELGAFGIRANVVAPGLVTTPMTARLPSGAIQAALDESALGRAGEPEDVAWPVIFLLSDMARQITGEVIKVDGGQYI